MGRLSGHVLLAAALLVVVMPDVAWACPVCGMASTTDNAWAYTVMSVMLTVLPLGMIGGAVYWVSQRVSAAESEMLAPRPPAKDVGHVPQHPDAVQLLAPRD